MCWVESTGKGNGKETGRNIYAKEKVRLNGSRSIQLLRQKCSPDSLSYSGKDKYDN